MPDSEVAQPELGHQWRGVTPCKIINLTSGKLFVSQGSVVAFEGDAIVNAANKGCLGGGGVDGAITSAGGEELARARQNLPILSGGVLLHVWKSAKLNAFRRKSRRS